MDIPEASTEARVEQMLASGASAVATLHTLTEGDSAKVPAVDAIVRTLVERPDPVYEAYVALSGAKDRASAYAIDPDAQAVRAVRDVHAPDALSEALVFVVDVPEAVDRQARIDLLMQPEHAVRPGPGFEVAPYQVTTPLAFLATTDLTMPTVDPSAAPALSLAEHETVLRGQLAGLDADRHQVVVHGTDGATGYLAATSKGFEVRAEPAFLRPEDVVAALPTLRQLDADGQGLELVSESARHHYVVLTGLDAGEARELTDRYGANLMLKTGDEHTAVVRLTEASPERAAAIAGMLRVRYALDDDGPSPAVSQPAVMVEGVSEQGTDRAAIDQFAVLRSEEEARRPGGKGYGLDVAASQRMLGEGVAADQVAGAVDFLSPTAQVEDLGYGQRVARVALERNQGPSPKASGPELGVG